MNMKTTLSPFVAILATSSTAIILSGCASTASDMKDTAFTPMTASQTADAVMDWWPGDYDNDTQIAALIEDGVPIWEEGQGESETGRSLGGFLPVSAQYRSVDLPAFGDRVLYLEEMTFDDNPYRLRIYTVIADEESDTTRVKLWYFKDKEANAGMADMLSGLSSLTPEDMSPLPDNCDLYIEQIKPDMLEMKMPKNECKFGSRIYDYQVRLTPDEFWYRDRIVDAESMDVVSTAGSFGWHKLLRADAS